MSEGRVFHFRRGQWTLGERPYILGILNVTPDSFSDGSPAWRDPQYSIGRVGTLIDQGADAVDIGAESTRPGHVPISAGEEWMRLEPILTGVRERFPEVPISVDTYKPEVALRALEQGVDIINDIWGLSRDPALASLVHDARAGYIGMFNQPGDPTELVALADIQNFFGQMLETAAKAGLSPDSVLIDPGIGFRVQGDSTWRVLTHLAMFSGLGAGTLVGHSRKRFLGSAANIANARDRDAATAIVSALIVLGGADVLRVHNPEITRQAILIAQQWRRADGSN